MKSIKTFLTEKFKEYSKKYYDVCNKLDLLNQDTKEYKDLFRERCEMFGYLLCLKDMTEFAKPLKPYHNDIYKSYHCSNCDMWLLNDDEVPNENDTYCSKCGIPVDWSNRK